MKIWIPTLQYQSGASVYIERLTKVLLELGHDVECTSFSILHQFFPYFLKFKKPTTYPDIIITDTIIGGMFKNKGNKLIVIEHNSIFDPLFIQFRNWKQALLHEILWKYFEAKSFKESDKIVCVSQFTASSLENYFGRLRIDVILNGIDTEFFSPQIKHSLPSKPINLLFVGNMTKRKGFHLLPKLMENLGSDYHLRYTAGLRTSSFNLDIPNSTPLGRLSQQEILKEYRNADILIFPTRFEGFGYAAAEAMACGLPVVSTKTSAITELITNNENGILCDIDDIDCFSESIRKLTDNPTFYKKIADAARKQAVKSFSQTRWQQEWGKLLDNNNT